MLHAGFFLLLNVFSVFKVCAFLDVHQKLALSLTCPESRITRHKMSVWTFRALHSQYAEKIQCTVRQDHISTSSVEPNTSAASINSMERKKQAAEHTGSHLLKFLKLFLSQRWANLLLKNSHTSGQFAALFQSRRAVFLKTKRPARV